MKKEVLKFSNILLMLLIIFSPFYVFAYIEGDEPVTSSKVYNFLIDDINSEDVVRLYNPHETLIPNYFNLDDYFYEKYNFHIPVANQKNLGLCDTFSSIKSIETNYALKTGKYIDVSERYFDFMTSEDFLGERKTGFICENNICDDGDGSSHTDVSALIQSFGAPLEKEIPYVNYDENDYDLFNNSQNILKLNSVIKFPNLQNIDNQIAKEEWIKIIKIHIMKYGSIRASVCGPNKNIYNSETSSAYQTTTCTVPGHGVSIVGWDDNFSKDNFKVTPEHDGAYIILNSYGKSWGDNGYYYISYDDINILVQLTGVLDVVEAKKYNVYSTSSKMFVSNGWGIPKYGGLYNFTAMKFDRVKENEYLSHIAISASDGYITNNSTRVRFYLNPIDDTFDKEKLIYLGEELPTLTGAITIITLDEPIKIIGDKFALVYEVVGDTSRFTYENAVDKDGNRLHGFTYTTKGWNQHWNLTNSMYTVFPSFVFTIDGIVKNASIKTEPSKKEYIRGQSIDLTGGILNVTYDDSTTTEIDMTDSAVKLYDYDTSMLGTQKVTLLYEGNFLIYNITVKNDIKSISVNTNPTKTTYTKGERLDLTGGKITAIYEDNSTENILMVDKSVSVTGYSPNILGNQNITITYKGKTVTFNINVIEQTYTVTFNSNGGSSVASQTINYNEKATNPSNPTKTGYTFKRWLLNGEEYNFDTPVTSNITLTAEWEINKYTVTFNSNGGSNITSQIVNYNNTATKPNNPTRDGYTFKKWLLNGGEYNFGTAVTSNITLTAEWEKQEIDENDTLKDILEKDGHVVNNSYTSKFTLGDSIASIKNKLGNDVTIETDKNIIATGAIIKRNNESYTVVVKGDLNGDGRINSADLLQMRKYLLEEVNLTGAYKEAGIIESNGEIKSLDLLRLRQYLLDEYVFK